MDRTWVGKTENHKAKSSLRTLIYCLLVDVIPVLLLLSAMAYGMALVSGGMAGSRTVEIAVVSERLG